ncbi:RNA polymerase sigma factor [Sporolactobacillus shoreae]|uniref:RNA polymerase sigma factor n=1 Tax=Sporolactobacillus shoreae TaxID=1465501 RepID=A0A4Z0GQ14_9BACL|nr:RNA polymerase sigma factor [Sporolactobacillus shoreae]
MDKRTLSEWFNLYSDDLKHYLVYRMGTADVDDLVQETFIKVINAIDAFQFHSSPKTWLFSIARNVAIDELRRRKRLKWLSLVPDFSKHEPEGGEMPESVLGLNNESALIYKAILKLRPNYRDVVTLRGIKELSVGETAQILNWSENKVRSTYHRARKVLKEELGGILNE